MNKFKLGDRVRVIKEPYFVTIHNNDVWEMYPQESEYMDFGNGLVLKNMFGRANLQHLIGEEGVIDEYSPLLMDPTQDKDGGWYSVKFDKKDVAIPRGLKGFSKNELELVNGIK